MTAVNAKTFRWPGRRRGLVKADLRLADGKPSTKTGRWR
jgi:hypothetical protein